MFRKGIFWLVTSVLILIGLNLAISFNEPFKRWFMKWLLVVFSGLGIVGCSTVHFTSPPPTPVSVKVAPKVADIPSQKQSDPIQVLTAAELSANQVVVPVASSMSTYRYGRFDVEVANGRQTVIGGEFIPGSFPQDVSAGARHVLLIDHTTKELAYYRKLASGSYEPMIGFAVVTPLATSLPSTTVRGQVTQIVHKPTWCPKVGGTVRRDDPSLPKGCLPYGHPQNAMGDIRFDIAWPVKGWDLIKVHGTTGYPQGSFWLEDTHGCTRLENKAIKKLVEIIGPNAVKEGIEVILQKGNPLLLHVL